MARRVFLAKGEAGLLPVGSTTIMRKKKVKMREGKKKGRKKKDTYLEVVETGGVGQLSHLLDTHGS